MPCWDWLPGLCCSSYKSFIFSLQLSAEGKKRLSGELSEDIGEYDYNNANDTANFCPGLQVHRTLLLDVTASPEDGLFNS